MPNRNEINDSRLSEALDKIEKGDGFTFSMAYPTDGDFYFINSLLAKILNRMDRIYLLETLISIIREIILNASKANYKRVFFNYRGLDIHDRKDYALGMEHFKSAIKNLELIKTELAASIYRIEITIKRANGYLSISTSNNAGPTEEERDRMMARVEKARDITDFTSAYDTVFDPSEGAGLGIVLVFLLLRNAGIDNSLLRISSGNDYINFTLDIPDSVHKPETASAIRDKIIHEIDSLPTLPHYVTDLKSMCADPGVSIENLSAKISGDPSLTADVMRLANSAGFMTGKRIESVTEAIVIIGLKNLDLILTMAAAKKILEQRYKRFEQIWNHCTRTASYARIICQKKGMKKIGDSAFIAGLLHDIGKIVLLAVDMERVREIAEIVRNKKIISTTILEEISLGISHSDIGTVIAKKWNFPDYIVESIRSHHSPLNTRDPFSELVAVVYMANMLCEIENQNAHYSFIETEMLDFFGLKGKADIEAFHESVKASYASLRTF